MGFKEDEFSAKLAELTNTQASIETMSTYIIHHRKHSKKIVKLWRKQLFKAAPRERVTLIFLANDVIQNAKRKTAAFGEDFQDVLPGAFQFAYSTASENERKSILRVLDIWSQRGVYEADLIQSIKLSMTGNGGPISRKRSNDSPSVESSSRKEPKTSDVDESEDMADDDTIPDHETLINLLTSLDTKAASGDRPIREKISKLPPEVQDTSFLDKINDLQSAEKLSKTVDEACDLLNDYNARLADEMQERKKAAAWLRNFIADAQTQITKTETMLSDYKTKLEQVAVVRSQLNDHINNLPDLNDLKTAPLPSLNQLFKNP